MPKLFRTVDIVRILLAQPGSEVTSWLSGYAFSDLDRPPPQLERLVILYNSFNGGRAVLGPPWQLDVFQPFTPDSPLGTTQRFNVESSSPMSIRSPGTLRVTLTAVELRRPPFFPQPRPR